MARHAAHQHRAADPATGPIASSSRIVAPRADPEPTSSSSGSFNGQSYALGLLTGLGIAAALLGSYLYIRTRQAAQKRKNRTTLTPDKYSYVVPGSLAGHHIITEPVLGQEDEEARRPGSPTGTVMTGDGWGAASSVQDLMGPSTPNSAYAPSLPAAMRDARGRFHAPSEPGSPLAIPDRAFTQDGLVRVTSTTSGSSHGNRSSSLFTPLTSRSNPFSHRQSLASQSSSLHSSSTAPVAGPNPMYTHTPVTTVPIAPITGMTNKERIEKENALKARLGMRLRNASVDELRIVNAGPSASSGGGDGALPPYSREEDPDPFKR